MSKRDWQPVDRTDEAGIDQSAYHLCQLEVALKKSTLLRARYVGNDSKSPPVLHVSHPQVSNLSETVFSRPLKDSAAWSFWFSWGDEICPATEPEVAAKKIADLLATKEEPG